MADALDLGSSAARRVGSSPTFRTSRKTLEQSRVFQLPGYLDADVNVPTATYSRAAPAFSKPTPQPIDSSAIAQ